MTIVIPKFILWILGGLACAVLSVLAFFGVLAIVAFWDFKIRF